MRAAQHSGLLRVKVTLLPVGSDPLAEEAERLRNKTGPPHCRNSEIKELNPPQWRRKFQSIGPTSSRAIA
jgi:hypothetical protein